MEPFLALITPLAQPPTQPPQPPIGIWGPTDPRPTPPIAGPNRPPWWGMAQDPSYGIPVGGVPHPSHPIHWGPGGEIGGPPYPSQGPGFPTPPIAGPGRPPWWGMAQDPGYGVPLPPQPGDATPPPSAPPKPEAPPPPEGGWYWQGVWQLWVWVPTQTASPPPPAASGTPPPPAKK